MDKLADLLKNRVCKRGGNAPVIEDASISLVLPTGHEYAGAKLLFKMRRQPTDKAAVVSARWKMKSKDAEQFLASIVTRHKLTPDVVIPDQCERIGPHSSWKSIQWKFLECIRARVDAQPSLGYHMSETALGFFDGFMRNINHSCPVHWRLMLPLPVYLGPRSPSCSQAGGADGWRPSGGTGVARESSGACADTLPMLIISRRDHRFDEAEGGFRIAAM